MISLSLGDDAEFRFGGLIDKTDPYRHPPVYLRSGDAFVFGGSARMCFNGIAKVYPGTGPKGNTEIGRAFRRRGRGAGAGPDAARDSAQFLVA